MGIFGADIPSVVDLILIGETLLAALLIAALILAAIHRGKTHHYLMLSVFIIDFVIFKPLMLMRAFDGSNGIFPWDGSYILYHLIVSIIVAVLGLVTVYLGFRKMVKKDGKMFMPKKGRIHNLVGASFIVLWLVTYTIGIWIFYTTWI